MRLKYVQRVGDYWYFRRGGVRSPLPDPAKNFDAFMAAYNAALRGVPDDRRKSIAPEGSMAQVIERYLQSRAFRELKPNSQKTYMAAIRFLQARPSVMAHVSAFDAENIDDLLDEVSAERPGMALLLLKTFRNLFIVARMKKWLTGDPLVDIKPPKGGRYRDWNDAELLAFEERWPRGTRERLVYELALRTGQRRGDLAKMTWADVKGGKIEVVQQKTGEKVKAVIHSSLAKELETAPRGRAVNVLTTEKGLPFTPSYLGVWFARAIEAAGLPDDCVLHGLRKTLATRLADKGATPHQVMSMTGHRTLGMVAEYTDGANREKLAEEAGRLLEDDEPRTPTVKL